MKRGAIGQPLLKRIGRFFILVCLVFMSSHFALAAQDDVAFEDDTLPSEQAFAFSPPTFDGSIIHLRWVVAPDHYLYKSKLAVKVRDPEGMTAGDVQLPNGEVKQDEFFGRIEALHDQVAATVPIQRADATKPASFLLDLRWQGCAESILCYPPEIKTFKVVLPAVTNGQTPTAEFSEIPSTEDDAKTEVSGSLSEQDNIATRLAGGNIILTLLSFLGFGLLLAFTPCVFPMIPILSGIIVGQKHLTSRKAFFLSLTYVLAMALTYTIAGVLAGLFGQNLQAVFQNPWIIGVFSGIFVLLALSMFGFYELQMPSSIQSRLNDVSNRQSGGSLLGVAIMGILSALIVGPCVAAPLAGALIYIGQTGDAVLGGAALFALSLGMGIPLLLVGTSAGKWLPHAGMWMETIRAVFGVMLLAVAIWMLERVLPPAITLPLWAALFVISAVFMGALSHLPEGVSNWHKFWKGVGILLLLHGSLLMVGSATGGSDLLQPLRGVMSGLGTAAVPALPFKQVQGLDGLQKALAEAKGKPVMLDFYADWCTSCHEMEKYTFPDPAVQAVLQGLVLLKADVTANAAEDKAMMRQLKVTGPPTTLFFGPDGEERQNSRQVGFLTAEAFTAHVRKALK
jgi:thiol:disulfide interchange protein DsbD